MDARGALWAPTPNFDPILEPLGEHFRQFWCHLGPPWATLGPTWCHFGTQGEPKRAQNEHFYDPKQIVEPGRDVHHFFLDFREISVPLGIAKT